MPKPDPKTKKTEYVFKTTPAFKRALESLNGTQRTQADAAFKIFKADPFDPQLRPHKINKLTSRYRRTIHSVTIAGDLKAVFYVDGNSVVSVDIGTHDIYK